MFDILMIFLKELFQKVRIEKISNPHKTMKNYPVCNESALFRFKFADPNNFECPIINDIVT